MKIGAHRGIHTEEIENTLPALAQAMQAEVDFIECDIRKTKDGKLIIFHDEDIQGHPIKALTWSEAKIKANISIPTVGQVAKLAAKGNSIINWELKEPGYEKEVIETIKKYLPLEKCIFSSFYDEVVKTIKDNYPEVEAGLLVGLPGKIGFRARMRELFPLRRVKECKADYIIPHFLLLRFGFLRRMQKAQIPVIVWTIETIEQFEKLKGEYLAGIIADNTHELEQHLNGD